MKKILILIVLFATLFTTSCDKMNRYTGDTTMEKNGVEWSGNNYAYNRDNTDYKSFSLDSRVEISSSIVEKLSIFKIPCEEGTFYLSKTGALTRDSLIGATLDRILESDQLTGAWSLPEEPDSSNYIQITFYDECNGTIEGNFNCTLFGVTLGPNQPLTPDTVYITNGYFEGRIDNEW